MQIHLPSNDLKILLCSIQLYAKEAGTKIPVISAEQISFDNRARQFGTPDQIFNYFSSIQLVNKFGISLLFSLFDLN